MADLRVTDAAMTAAQREFTKTAARLTQDAEVVHKLDPDGAEVPTDAIREQDSAMASGLADVAAGLNALATWPRRTRSTGRPTRTSARRLGAGRERLLRAPDAVSGIRSHARGRGDSLGSGPAASLWR